MFLQKCSLNYYLFSPDLKYLKFEGFDLIWKTKIGRNASQDF